MSMWSSTRRFFARPAEVGRVVRDGAGLADALDQHLAGLHAAADQHLAHRLRPAHRQLFVVRDGAGRVGVALHPDAVLRVLRQDVAQLGDLLHRFRLKHRAVAVEEQLGFEIYQDAVLGALGVLRYLLQLLRLLVEVVPGGPAGDAADGRADRRALPAARDRADARADARAARGA